MKATTLHAIAALFLMMALAIPFEADDCPNCDCYQFPLPTKCEKCCAVITGTVTSVSDASITVDTGETTKKEPPRKFVITPKTRKNATIRKNSFATVYYHRNGDIAEQIDMVEALDGLLVPANLEDPPVPSLCGPVPPDALRVYLGDSIGWSSLPEMTVLSYKGAPIIQIRRAPKGIVVEAHLMEQDGRPAAVIIDNRLYLNPDGYFHVSRPDAHSLELYDRGGTLVFDLRFINPHSVTVIGKFELPYLMPLMVHPSGIVDSGNNLIREMCAGNRPVMFKITGAGSFEFGGVDQ